MQLITNLCLILTFIETFLIRARTLKRKVKIINPPPANSEYIFMGYNVFYGNPHISSIDPGYRQPIFEEDFAGIKALEAKGCMSDMSNTTISSASDYQKSLSVDVPVPGELTGLAFTANPYFKIVSEKTQKSSSEMAEQKIFCTRYKVSVTPNAPKPQEYFIEDLTKLPPYESKNLPAYVDFFKNYGTHCISEIILGARFGRLITILSGSSSNSRNINMGVKTSETEKVGIGINNTDSKESVVTTEETFSIGVMADDTTSSFRTELLAAQSFMPVQLKLIQLNECVSTWRSFKKIITKSEDITRISGYLETALKNYCKDILLPNKEVDSCSPPVAYAKTSDQLVNKGFYKIISAKYNNLCMEAQKGQSVGFTESIVKGNVCSKVNTQTWRMFTDPAIPKGDWRILFGESKLALEVMWNEKLFGLASRYNINFHPIWLSQMAVYDADYQNFFLDKNQHTGNFKIKLRKSKDKCLSLESGAEYSNLVQMDCDQSTEWIFKKVSSRKKK